MAKHYSAYNDQLIRPVYPMTRTLYKKVGSKWVVVEVEKELISYKQAKNVLNPRSNPFSSRERRYLTDRYRHNYSYDTIESYSPRGDEKFKFYIDWVAGDNALQKLVKKSYYDKLRYRRKKGKV